jgi:hypothetical protein
MPTEMRDKINVPQNQVYQNIQTHGIQQPQPIVNYGQQLQPQNCMPSLNSYAQNIPYNNNYVMTRFMY